MWYILPIYVISKLSVGIWYVAQAYLTFLQDLVFKCTHIHILHHHHHHHNTIEDPVSFYSHSNVKELWVNYIMRSKLDALFESFLLNNSWSETAMSIQVMDFASWFSTTSNLNRHHNCTIIFHEVLYVPPCHNIMFSTSSSVIQLEVGIKNWNYI